MIYFVQRVNAAIGLSPHRERVGAAVAGNAFNARAQDRRGAALLSTAGREERLRLPQGRGLGGAAGSQAAWSGQGRLLAPDGWRDERVHCICQGGHDRFEMR
ncbi:hypothetical protein CTS44_17332 [Comamonas thiooxydans]|nr:hypothetical protein CTS44_17332 [Comamonas thiooxydans]